jgi:hypothetical protein
MPAPPPPYASAPFIHNPIELPQEHYDQDGNLVFYLSKTNGTYFATRGATIPLKLKETLIPRKGDKLTFSLRMTNKSGPNKPVIKCHKPKHTNLANNYDPISIEAVCKNNFGYKARLTSIFSREKHHTTVVSDFRHLRQLNLIMHCKDSCYTPQYDYTDSFLMIRGTYAGGEVEQDIPIRTLSKLLPRPQADKEDSNTTTLAAIFFSDDHQTLAEPTPHAGRPSLKTEYSVEVLRNQQPSAASFPPAYPGYGTEV